MYTSSKVAFYPTAPSQQSETKYCELCGNIFIRHIELETDPSTGLIRRIGPKTCPPCESMHGVENRGDRAFKKTLEVLEHLKVLKSAHRRVGAEHPAPSTTRVHRRQRKYVQWVSPLLDAFAERRSMSSHQIAVIMGGCYPSIASTAVTTAQRVLGRRFVVVGHLPRPLNRPKGRQAALYSLAPPEVEQ